MTATARKTHNAYGMPLGSPEECSRQGCQEPSAFVWKATDRNTAWLQDEWVYVCTDHHQAFLDAGKEDEYWDAEPLEVKVVEPEPAPIQASMLAALEEAARQRREQLAAQDAARQVAAPAITSTEGTMSSVTQEARTVVEATVVAPNVVAFATPDGATQALRTPQPVPGERGSQVHVALKVDQRYSVAEVGAPGSLGALTGLTPPRQLAAPGQAPSTLGRGLRFVKNPENFYVAPELERHFEALEKLSAAGKAVRIRLIGPTGVGKTTAAYHLAAKTNRPFVKVNMSTVQSPEELFGMRTAENGTTGFQQTAFVEALRTPRTVIFLEEINRTHSSNVNPLMEIMDGFGETWVDAIQELIVVDPSVIIIAAMNVGAAYTGTFDMDAALESRFEYPIELNYLPQIEEGRVLVLKTGVDPKIAAGMVELANDTRRMALDESANGLDKAISTRTLLAACDLIAIGGLTPAEALQSTVLPLYSTEGGAGSQRERVGKLVQGKFSRGR